MKPGSESGGRGADRGVLGAFRHVALEALGRLAVRHPWTVLAAAAALTLGALAVLPRIRIVTDRAALVSSDDPALQRFREVSETFGALSLAIVVLEGEDRQGLRGAADGIAAALEGEPLVRSVFYKLDLDFFMRHALVYLDTTQLRCVRDAVGSGEIGSLGEIDEPGLLGLVEGVRRGIETASPDQAIPRRCEAISPLAIMRRFFDETGRWVNEPDRDELEIIDSAGLAQASLSEYGVDQEGYLVEADGETPHLVIMLVQPATTAGDEDDARALTTSLRRVARRVAHEHGVSAGVTGMPAIITDEMDTVRRDVRETILSAIFFVLLLFAITFRSLRATILVAIPLALGLVWTAGFAAVAYTRLTMVSVYFAAVLYGLGVAFAIHLLARFDEALRAGETPEQAVRTALVGAGPGIITGGMTTSAAFLAVGLVEFEGFAQLGIVAGVGVILMLVGSLTVMPVALVKWRGAPLAEPKARTWLGKLGEAIAGASAPIVLIAVVLVAWGFDSSRRLVFDYDFYKLLPRDAEAIRVYRTLGERTDFNSDVAISVTTSLEEAETRRSALEALATVARAESVTRYLPGSVEEQRDRVSRIQRVAEKAQEPLRRIGDEARETLRREQGPEPAKLAAALEALGDSVEDAWFAAQQTKRREAPELAALRDTIRRSASTVKSAPPEVAARRLAAFEQKVFRGLADGTKVLLDNLNDPAIMEPSDLPDDVRERFMAEGPDGLPVYAIYAYPTGQVGDREFLTRYVEEMRELDPEVTGFPLTHYHHGAMASRAFFQAALYASIAVLLLLALDFWSLRDLVLAAVPLAVGSAMMLATMAVLGWDYNFVNVVAFPLVIGAGVDFGVHLVHRFRQEGSASGALRTTGRPVILSAVTTIVGMGGLAMAEHRGAASLGILLVLGIGYCLLAAALVLPAVMDLMTRKRVRRVRAAKS